MRGTEREKGEIEVRRGVRVRGEREREGKRERRTREGGRERLSAG